MPATLRPCCARPDGQVTQLVEHDVLLHRSLGPFDRTEHQRPLHPGSTLLLYTDGLVERRRRDMDAAVAQLISLLARHGRRPIGRTAPPDQKAAGGPGARGRRRPALRTHPRSRASVAAQGRCGSGAWTSLGGSPRG
ncbi:SpoIIE family protein phosphatase [Streptomyces vinaceus]|uniref:SpoIIE family protein phosphatase n=1 Tax=Streptomyces vinaceus TaxID=1960 RepID=UPI0036A9BD36